MYFYKKIDKLKNKNALNRENLKPQNQKDTQFRRALINQIYSAKWTLNRSLHLQHHETEIKLIFIQIRCIKYESHN